MVLDLTLRRDTMQLDFAPIFDVLVGLSIGGVSVALIVLALVQAAKMFGLTGTLRIRGLAVSLGVLLTGVAFGLNSELLPVAWKPYVTWIVIALIGGLASMGLWELGERWLPGGDQQ